MTERTEVRFKIYNKTNNTVSANSVIPFNEVDFNVGGLYDISTYKYTFLVAGTYIIGESHTKQQQGGEVRFRLERNGIMRAISRFHNTNGFLNNTINSCLVYKFLVGDVLYCFTEFGFPKMNNFSYTTNDIYYSFWSIRLDY